MKFLSLMLVGMVLLLVSACSLRMGDFTLISTKNVALKPTPLRSGLQGKDCIYNFLGIPIGGLVPNVENAMDRAMENVPEGNMMTNAVTYMDTLNLLIFAQTCLRVKADVGRLE